MNAPQRASAKIFFTADAALTDFGPLFHRWIQVKRVPGLLIDVADYKHVPNGPGILLLGHEGDYWVGEANGRFSLQAIVKREWPVDDFGGRLTVVLDRLLAAADALASEADLNPTLDWSSLAITLLDRLHYPNTDAAYTAVLPHIPPILSARFGEILKLKRLHLDPRHPLGLWVETAVELETAAM